jgi:hypothetical protein
MAKRAGSAFMRRTRLKFDDLSLQPMMTAHAVALCSFRGGEALLADSDSEVLPRPLVALRRDADLGAETPAGVAALWTRDDLGIVRRATQRFSTVKAGPGRVAHCCDHFPIFRSPLPRRGTVSPRRSFANLEHLAPFCLADDGAGCVPLSTTLILCRIQEERNGFSVNPRVGELRGLEIAETGDQQLRQAMLEDNVRCLLWRPAGRNLPDAAIRRAESIPFSAQATGWTPFYGYAVSCRSLILEHDLHKHHAKWLQECGRLPCGM